MNVFGVISIGMMCGFFICMATFPKAASPLINPPNSTVNLLMQMQNGQEVMGNATKDLRAKIGQIGTEVKSFEIF
jgi:hypothetical protein